MNMGEYQLFTPLHLRDLVLRNRLALSPMCQYSALDGRAADWHLAHYGSRATLGLGLVLFEATAVESRGRISPGDLGLWKDGQVEALARIVALVKASGGAVGIQLAHAGRKSGISRPWEGGAQLDRSAAWDRVSASALAFKEGEDLPRELDRGEIGAIVRAFAASARRAEAAGFDVVEIHSAHGYLLHQFLSPLSNHRGDEYGGSLANRARLLLDVVSAVREVWPARKPLFVRVSAKDWYPGGWDLPECIELAKLLLGQGVDLMDISSGGLIATQRLEAGPGFQVPFARAIREGSGIPTGAVGLITEVSQAEAIIGGDSADLVLMGRELLRNPGWPWQALHELGAPAIDGRSAAAEAGVPLQYLRARR